MKHSLSFAIAAAFLAISCSEHAAPKVSVVPAMQPPAPVVLASAVPVSMAAQDAASDPAKLLADKVKRALENEPGLHAAAIDVTGAAGGVVTLWGTADSDDERIRAARVAYRIVGVNKVENKLATVKGS